jgi:DNA replication protein DnaC
MNNTTAYQQLLMNLDYLKLYNLKDKLNETVTYINNNNLSFIDGLIKLTNYEIDAKEKSMTKAMVKVGAFPHLKEVKDFDFSFNEMIDEKSINSFLSHSFIENSENIVFLGPSGVGKTHLATSIGISVAKKRMQTYFIKCHDLIAQLKKAKLENRLDDRIKHFFKYRLLIIDEIGYLPIEKEDSKLFFQLIDKRYEKKSTIFTTNISFDKWDEIFKDTVMANAILDRILHHCHVIKILGNSYRQKDHVTNSEES